MSHQQRRINSLLARVLALNAGGGIAHLAITIATKDGSLFLLDCSSNGDELLESTLIDMKNAKI